MIKPLYTKYETNIDKFLNNAGKELQQVKRAIKEELVKKLMKSDSDKPKSE